nr:hypothetical protein [Candidatus Enterousia merdequi]
MKKEYKEPIINTTSIKTSGFLLSFSGSYNQETYNCPIKPQISCDEYNASMQRWENAIEYAAKNKLNRTFLTGPGEMSCPRKTCPIFVEWQNSIFIEWQKQQERVKQLKREEQQKTK